MTVTTLHLTIAVSASFVMLHCSCQSEQRVVITNKMGEPISLWWAGPNGEDHFQGSLQAGDRLKLNSFVGHTFLARAEGTDRVLKEFSVTAGVEDVLLQEGSKTCSAPAACKDRHKGCRAHARADKSGCYDSPGWMVHFCAATCDKELNACHLSDPKIRCDRASLFAKHNVSAAPAFVPNSGQLQEFFDTIEERWPQYGARVISTNPPVAVLDSFLSEKEALALRSAAGLNSFKRSTASGTMDETGYTKQDVISSRTSSNAWCMGACEDDATVREVTQRIANVTGVRSGHFESFQLLRYQPGQFYQRHHDNSFDENSNPAGPRVLTFFLYLSDVGSGGETEFTDLKPPLKVKPRMGSAIVWPSVTDDMRTIHPLGWHRANPPGEGEEKFAANAWIHLHDYKIAQQWGCTGSFSDA